MPITIHPTNKTRSLLALRLLASTGVDAARCGGALAGRCRRRRRERSALRSVVVVALQRRNGISQRSRREKRSSTDLDLDHRLDVLRLVLGLAGRGAVAACWSVVVLVVDDDLQPRRSVRGKREESRACAPRPGSPVNEIDCQRKKEKEKKRNNAPEQAPPKAAAGRATSSGSPPRRTTRRDPPRLSRRQR